jgi:hypothetical protein
MPAPIVSKSTPWAARAAFLRALHATAPQLLASLREQLPNHPFWLAHFHASRTVRDYPEDLTPADRARAELARGEWITRLTRWAAPHGLPGWFLEACEETLEVRRLLLLQGSQDPVPTSWQPGERRRPGRTGRRSGSPFKPRPTPRPPSASHSASWCAADALGITLREPCRGGRGRRATGDPRQLVLRRAAFVVMPVRGLVMAGLGQLREPSQG